MDAQGVSQPITWGSYYTVMISLDQQPLDITFVHKDQFGVVRRIENTLEGIESKETISFLPETMPDVQVHMDGSYRLDPYTTVILDATSRTMSYASCKC